MDAVNGTISYSGEDGKVYSLNKKTAVLIPRYKRIIVSFRDLLTCISDPVGGI